MHKHKILVIGSSKYYSHTFDNALYPDVEFAFINHRGFHDTYDTKPYIEQTLTNDIEQCRKDIGWEKFSILGHSIHAFMVIDYTEQFPQHIEKVILIGTSPVVGEKIRFESDQLWQHEATDARKAALQYNIEKEELYQQEIQAQRDAEDIEEEAKQAAEIASKSIEKRDEGAVDQAKNTVAESISQANVAAEISNTSDINTDTISASNNNNSSNVVESNASESTSTDTAIGSNNNNSSNTSESAGISSAIESTTTDITSESTTNITAASMQASDNNINASSSIVETSTHTPLNQDSHIAKILNNMKNHEETKPAWISASTIEVQHQNQADKYNQEHHIMYDQEHAHPETRAATTHIKPIIRMDHNEGARDLSEMWEGHAVSAEITDTFIRRMLTYTPMLWYDYEFEASVLWKNVQINHDWANYIWGKFWIHKNLGISISRMNKPVILYMGKYDFWNPVSLWNDYRNLSNLRIQIFHRSGHNPHYEEKIAFANSLNEWLNKE